jgi:lipopolysaccharide cholinephosphotransferase
MASKLKITKPSIIRKLYNLWYKINQIFSKHNIEYWASGGTYLGAVRHGGIIPWDDDLDICITDEKALLKLKPVLKKCGLKIASLWFGYKIYDEKNSVMQKEDGDDFSDTYGFPNCDIFPMKLVKKNNPYYEQKYKIAREEWPKERYFLKDLYPLIPYNFGNFYIWGGHKYTRYFNSMYGRNWNKVAYRQYDHQKQEKEKNFKVIKLTDKDRVPAKPIPKLVRIKCLK